MIGTLRTINIYMYLFINTYTFHSYFSYPSLVSQCPCDKANVNAIAKHDSDFKSWVVSFGEIALVLCFFKGLFWLNTVVFRAITVIIWGSYSDIFGKIQGYFDKIVTFHKHISKKIKNKKIHTTNIKKLKKNPKNYKNCQKLRKSWKIQKNHKNHFKKINIL